MGAEVPGASYYDSIDFQFIECVANEPSSTKEAKVTHYIDGDQCSFGHYQVFYETP
jgi:hypothetical protein